MTAPPAWHALEAGEALSLLGSDAARGLEPEEAAARLARDGENALRETGGRGRWSILADQLSSVMVALLGGAAAVSALLGDRADAAAILAIVALNAALGYFQEEKAEKALAALKRLAVPVVKVRRGARVRGSPRASWSAGTSSSWRPAAASRPTAGSSSRPSS